jgi:hypothetical protein
MLIIICRDSMATVPLLMQKTKSMTGGVGACGVRAGAGVADAAGLSAALLSRWHIGLHMGTLQRGM